MRRFVVHALLFVLTQLFIGLAIWRACPTDANHYMAATIDKHARLRGAATDLGRRLIFVGGSGVAFGVDSREFTELGYAPVNMGLNVGLGLSFMLGEVEGSLREGDVVLVIPETHLYWTPSKNDAIWEVLQQRPASVACLAGPHARELSDQALHFLARRVRCAAHQISSDRPQPAMYRRQAFDEYGDFVAHRELPRVEQDATVAAWPDPDAAELDGAIARLQRFARACERAGARCLLTWAPIRAARLRSDAALFERIEARLRAEVPLELLERPSEVVFADDEFFDGGVHLSGAGATRRSRQLAARLARALN